MALLEALEGMVGHAVRPSSPMVVPPATEESTAATGGLGGDERFANRSATVPEAMVETTESSGTEAGAVDAVPVFGTERHAAPKEQAALPEASEGVVKHAVRPPSPLVVPPATEEDKVEEIEHEEARPQAI